MATAGTPRPAAEIEAELEGIESAQHEQLLADDKSDEQGIADADELEVETAKLEGREPVLKGKSKSDDGKSAAEAEAGRKGWVPKDQYKGDPAKWVDAKTFIARGERFNANLQREVETLRKELESFKGTAKAFADFSKAQLAQKDTELKEAISALRIQRAEALRDGDATLSVEIEDRIDLLKEQQKETKEVVAEVKEVRGPDLNDPVMIEWQEDGNQWFKNDPKLAEYAVRVGNQLIADGETVKGRPFLDKVAAMMRTQFPRRFRELDAKAAGTSGRSSTVEAENSGSTPAKKYSGKSEKDLPAEDLALMKEYIKEGWMTKDAFLTSYFSRNG